MDNHSIRAPKRELKLLRDLRRVSADLVRTFALPNFNGVFVNETLIENSCYGWCRVAEGKLEIRLRRPDGQFYSIEKILDTLAHELAHLAEPNHDKRHKILYYSIYIALRRNF